MIIVTGGAGLIGATIVRELNANGITEITIVDNLNSDIKKENLKGLHYQHYFDKKEFLQVLLQLNHITAILHQGACSSTTETDEVYLKANNVEYSKTLLAYSIQKDIPFIYASSASVYGDGKRGFDDNSNDYFPINGYAHSKLEFDQYVTELLTTETPSNKIIGLRYFNVYGYGEAHKVHMSSVVYKFYQSYLQNKEICVFEGSDKILRDFITVDDVVAVNRFCLEQTVSNGIYNVGTGKAASFYDLALAFQQQFPDAQIKDIAFPEILRNRYQFFTEAPMQKLRTAGYTKAFETIQVGVQNYIHKLIQNA
jgi:ADP-L-glycero-D-manno-heptose 6-epimerase